MKGGKKKRKKGKKTTEKGKYRMHIAKKISGKVLRILLPRLGNFSSFFSEVTPTEVPHLLIFVVCRRGSWTIDDVSVLACR